MSFGILPMLRGPPQGRRHVALRGGSETQPGVSALAAHTASSCNNFRIKIRQTAAEVRTATPLISSTTSVTSPGVGRTKMKFLIRSLRGGSGGTKTKFKNKSITVNDLLKTVCYLSKY